MDNILITGANGFLGSNLVKYFVDKGYNVTAVIRLNGKVDNLCGIDCHIIEYDEKISSLEKVITSNTIVIHTASYYITEHKKEDIQQLIISNISYGLNLLEAMRINGAKKIINIGTAWQGYKEEERRPVNLYAATKQSFEDFIAYYCDAEDFSAVSIRLNDTYGEEDKRMKLVRLLINSAVNYKPLDMSTGEQIINLTHISDVCRAIYASVDYLNTHIGLSKYNLINDDEYSLKDLVKFIEGELKIKIPVNFGVKAYRSREVMIPLKSNKFDLCKMNLKLGDGVRKIKYNMESSS